jgi:hypothetical protein
MRNNAGSYIAKDVRNALNTIFQACSYGSLAARGQPPGEGVNMKKLLIKAAIKGLKIKSGVKAGGGEAC